MSKSKTIYAAAGAPAAIGPYSQAVGAGDFVFLSGQTGIDPATGEFVPGGVPEQTRQIFRNLRAVLEAAGLTLGDVIKTTVFLTDLAQFAPMNAVYAENFPDGFPARSCVQVAALPKGAQIEIELIAEKNH